MMSNNCYGQKVNMTIKEDGSNRIKKQNKNRRCVQGQSVYSSHVMSCKSQARVVESREPTMSKSSLMNEGKMQHVF